MRLRRPGMQRWERWTLALVARRLAAAFIEAPPSWSWRRCCKAVANQRRIATSSNTFFLNEFIRAILGAQNTQTWLQAMRSRRRHRRPQEGPTHDRHHDGARPAECKGCARASAAVCSEAVRGASRMRAPGSASVLTMMRHGPLVTIMRAACQERARRDAVDAARPPALAGAR